MISLTINNRAGICSLWTIAASQLLKIPADESVHIYANSPLYAPEGDNVFSWFFRNSLREKTAVEWPESGIDIETYPFNTKLGLDKERLATLRELVARRFVPRPDPPLSADMQEHLSGMVGIHYRGTDKKTEVPRIDYEQVLRSYEQHGGGRPVFMATDEVEAAEWFRTRLNGLILHPHARVSGDEGVHTVVGGFRQAREAMFDLFCLAACRTLLVGRGNLSDCACWFSRTDDIHYHEDA